MSAFVQTARIVLSVFVLSVAVYCAAAFAELNPNPTSPIGRPESTNSNVTLGVQRSPENDSGKFHLPKLALLALNPAGYGSDRTSFSEPFSMPAKTDPTEEMSAKWNELQSRILADERVIAACRSSDDACTPAARLFLSLAQLGDRRERRAQLGWLNRAVNLAIRPESDWVQYGYADYWASPLQTLSSRAGDCEDYAIVKYVALKELGFAASDLRFVVVQDTKHQVEHAVIAVRDDQEWLILDNRTMLVLDAVDARYYTPLFAFNQPSVQTLASATGDRITDR
jgi:predicted transglutaminase-like cysteine proteinase